MPRSRSGSARNGSPSTVMRPRVGASTPRSMRRKVVLPQPLAPTMVTKLPLATSSEIRSSTLRSPNDFQTLCDVDRAHAVAAQGNRRRLAEASSRSIRKARSVIQAT